MLADYEDVYVTKFVDLVARIPKHLDLNFSDFSTILYGIYRFIFIPVLLGLMESMDEP